MPQESFDAIVVGAGFGGAACAALLAKRGARVLLLEKNARAGGKAMVVSKNGFTYELWPVIHAPAQESRCVAVLRELGMEGEVDLVFPRVRGAIYIDSSGALRRFPDDPSPDPAKVFDAIGVAPEERERALAVLTELVTMSAADAAALDEVSFAQWLEQRQTPRPVATYLHAIANGVFMVPSDLLAASEAIRTVQEILLRGGGLYCRNGGIGRLAEVYASAVEKFGGRVLYRTRVRKIAVREGRVTGVIADKGAFAAPVVVSNAGLQPTVLRLAGKEHFDRSYVNYVRDLTPSWGMMGVRYFLRPRMLDEPFYMVFSDDAYWTTERWLRAANGDVPERVILWVQVPSAYDSALAPPDRQCVLTGVWCSPDPAAPEAEKEKWWRKVDEMMERVWPGFLGRVYDREPYDVREVSALSREPAFPGVGGECIGLGQVIGQCGRFKPSARAPLSGLFYVGADAEGYGCGTHLAVESGIRVAEQVERFLRLRRALFGTRTAPGARRAPGGRGKGGH